MSTPPGWYPVDKHVERWWDGSQWGPQTRRGYGTTPSKPMGTATTLVLVAGGLLLLFLATVLAVDLLGAFVIFSFNHAGD